MLKAIRLEFNK